MNKFHNLQRHVLLLFFLGTLRILIFARFEYVTNPRVKTLEEPLIEVIELESKPPVQDSAKEIFNLFLLNNLTTFWESFFMK